MTAVNEYTPVLHHPRQSLFKGMDFSVAVMHIQIDSAMFYAQHTKPGG